MQGRASSIAASTEPEVDPRAQHDEAMRTLGRHQWVREHDTPRVTILVGPPRSGRALWEEWLALTGRAASGDSLFEQPSAATPTWLERTAKQVVAHAMAAPREPISLAVGGALLQTWLRSRTDRLGAMVNEGIVSLPAGRRLEASARGLDPGKGLAVEARTPRPIARKARSSAEERLFEELERTPSTAGRFELNGLLSVAFGECSAEVDLLSRQDEVAIEVDGYHHFQDPVAYRRDRRKDLLLQAHGYAVLRFLAEDIERDAGQAVRAVLELLGHQRRRRRRKS
jgi:very-short-patch-repair endonuclease